TACWRCYGRTDRDRCFLRRALDFRGGRPFWRNVRTVHRTPWHFLGKIARCPRSRGHGGFFGQSLVRHEHRELLGANEPDHLRLEDLHHPVLVLPPVPRVSDTPEQEVELRPRHVDDHHRIKRTSVTETDGTRVPFRRHVAPRARVVRLPDPPPASRRVPWRSCRRSPAARSQNRAGSTSRCRACTATRTGAGSSSPSRLTPGQDAQDRPDDELLPRVERSLPLGLKQRLDLDHQSRHLVAPRRLIDLRPHRVAFLSFPPRAFRSVSALHIP